MKETVCRKTGIREIVDRRRAMVEGMFYDRILIGITNLSNRSAGSVPSGKRFLLPPSGDEMPGVVPVEIALESYIAAQSILLELPDDRLPIHHWIELFGQALLCAFLGVEIRYVSAGDTSTSEVRRRFDSIDDLLKLEFHEDNPLLQFILSSMRRGQALADGRCLLSPFLGRGGMATMTQLLGYDRAFLELYDNTDKVHAFFERVLAMELRVIDLMYEAIGSVEGGWAYFRFDWAPTRCVGLNLDDFLLCPNAIFDEFGLPYYQRMIDHFGYGVMHYHTPDMRLMKSAAKLRHCAVQVGSDPKLPEPCENLAVIKKACGDRPITWMRMPRQTFLRGMDEGTLLGNVEYLIGDAKDTDDAHRLIELARGYRATDWISNGP